VFNGMPAQSAECTSTPCVPRVQKKAAPSGEKPEPVRTHLRDVVVLPEMIGSLVGVYNGKLFNQVEIKVRPAARASYVCISCISLRAPACYES
jgi:Ribosomal protein S19